MSQYPQPIKLDAGIDQSRLRRRRDILFAIRWGIFLRLWIVLIEVVVYLFYDSNALLLDAIASGLDLMTSLFLYLFIHLASRPPDQDHPFGHGRYEPLAGLQLGLFIALVGGGMIIQQGREVLTPHQPEQLTSWLWVIPLGAVLLLEIGYQLINYKAKKQQSTALKAEALHFRIDALNSLFAAGALFMGTYWIDWAQYLDHAGALMIAALMVGLGLYAARENMHQLMDRAPERKYYDLVRAAALRVEGVLETEKLNIQRCGPDAHVDIDVEVDPHLTVEVAHEISQKVRSEIQHAWPAVRDVIVHIEPFYEGDH